MLPNRHYSARNSTANSDDDRFMLHGCKGSLTERLDLGFDGVGWAQIENKHMVFGMMNGIVQYGDQFRVAQTREPALKHG